ncbi:hypothetical protein J15TS10_43980 [Paenibacillus woosongensis]|uniref:Uncharacterized protein n=1 Tax=Paenibacillus woosongensis TaxID=307580 RepID=A0ABQ4MXE3_9BACL|nr:hypothetical protein J15TS10_43980 [Paenibacillus woosongensis]
MMDAGRTTTKPPGMSERAWVNLHKVIAKIHIKHFGSKEKTLFNVKNISEVVE